MTDIPKHIKIYYLDWVDDTGIINSIGLSSYGTACGLRKKLMADYPNWIFKRIYKKYYLV